MSAPMEERRISKSFNKLTKMSQVLMGFRPCPPRPWVRAKCEDHEIDHAGLIRFSRDLDAGALPYLPLAHGTVNPGCPLNKTTNEDLPLGQLDWGGGGGGGGGGSLDSDEQIRRTPAFQAERGNWKASPTEAKSSRLTTARINAFRTVLIHGVPGKLFSPQTSRRMLTSCSNTT